MRRTLGWLITLSVPFVLTMALVRLLTFPWYPAWDYGRAGFPEDPYGLSQEDRSGVVHIVNAKPVKNVFYTLGNARIVCII
jgi:hypothetical protein